VAGGIPKRWFTTAFGLLVADLAIASDRDDDGVILVGRRFMSCGLLDIGPSPQKTPFCNIGVTTMEDDQNRTSMMSAMG